MRFLKNTLAILLVWFCTYAAAGQDSTAIKKASAKNFGLSAGASYSILVLKSTPYFTESGTVLRNAEVVNAPGFNVGLFIYKPLKEKFSMRFAVDANMLPAYLSYDTGKPNKEESYIYPLTIDIPISFIYGRHFRYDVEAKSLFRSGLIAGIRPVIPLSLFNSTQPLLSGFNLNIDLGISQPIAMKKGIMRTDLFFSYGLLNLIGKDESNFRTNSINYLGRSFVGLRMYFN